MKPPSFFGWYEILRTHYHLSVFQSTRYAWWLACSPEIQQVPGEHRGPERKSRPSVNRRSRLMAFNLGEPDLAIFMLPSRSIEPFGDVV